MRERQAGFGFATLCLLAGTAPVLDGFAVELPFGLFGAGLRLAVLGAFFALAGARARGPWGGWRVALWGGVLVAGLPVAFAAGSGRVSGPTEFLLLALIPAAVVFFESQRPAAFGADRGAFRLLTPALAGLAGAGLLLTYAIPASLAGKAWLALMVLLAGAAGFAVVRLHSLLQGTSAVRAAASICAGGAAAYFAFSWIGWVPLGLAGSRPAYAITVVHLLLLDLPVLLLTAWLLRVLEPARFASRYLLALLVAVVESFALVQPGLSWTIGLGVLLLAGGAAALWRSDLGSAKP